MSILRVNNVSVRYMTGDFKDIGLKEYVVRKLTGNYKVHEFWADKDVSFSLEEGDMLGIIGTNGAGKSTLLKVISGIMEPTSGSVQREGTIAALLELASGFDNELTAKENAYLRGAMLGYTRKFMDEVYEQIMDFAELWEFEDRPFKQLSSGMKSRLAFSIASMLQPDILILDEVLSVGDGAFREKSEAKMKEIIQGGATTILVSHSLRQVRAMCSKILWLHKGRQVAFGDDVQMLCDAYEEFLKSGVLPTSSEEIEEMAAQTARQRELNRRKRTAPKAPKAPNLTIGLTGQGKPRLKWNKVEGAEKYVIYRAVGNGGTYEKIFTTSYLTFSNPSAEPGDICYYKIRALGKGGLSPFSNPEVVVSE